MEYKVFYSYQSDIDKNLNETFIEDALNDAVKAIKRAKLKIIKGFRGTSGNKPLAETMFDQSKDSDIFVGDVTFTSQRNKHIDKEILKVGKRKIFSRIEGDIKKSPNPNVLIETGYSWSEKDYDRTILVMNKAFGLPKEFPVDMSHVRWPIDYSLSQEQSHNEEYKEKQFNNLVLNLKVAIEQALITTQEYRRKKFIPFKQHEIWKSSDFGIPFIVTNEVKDIIIKLREGLNEPGMIQRIVGPKNSGKTRIARELYRKIDTSLKRDNSIEKVFYYPLVDDASYTSSIEKPIQLFRDLNRDDILIIDNCSSKTHKRICDELYGTNVRLLTICSVDDNNEDEFATIQIKSNVPKKIIEKAISNKFSQQQELSIIEESDNNLRKALVYSNIKINKEDNIETEYLQKWEQILGKELISKGGLKVLEELSLFTHIGFTNEYQNQSDFIIKQIEPTFSNENYRKIIEQLAEKGILTITGDFISLESFIEELAENRFRKFTETTFESYLSELISVRLSKPFGNRLKELHKKDPAKNIINVLTGDKGLIKSYDFINSDEGAKIIISLSEIAPEEVMNSLYDILSAKSYDELKLFDIGRRNIVETLRRLCFRKTTFNKAIRLLFKLAVAENESIGYNASSLFVQLFQAILPGTEEELLIRLEVLKQLANQPKDEEIPILLKSTERALQVGGWTRMSGPEKQAGEILRDHKPDKTEIKQYWEGIIEVLLQMNSTESSNIIIGYFNQQYLDGNREAILKAIEIILEKGGKIDKNLWQNFAHLKSRLKDPLEYEPIEKLIKKYSKFSTRESLEILVSLSPFERVKTESGEYIDKSEIKAREFARELIATNNNEWKNHLDILLIGEQRKTFAFGNELAKYISDKKMFIEEVIETLKNIPLENQNNNLIEGFVSEIKDTDLIREVIDVYLSIPKISFHAIRLLRFIPFERKDLDKIEILIKSNPEYTFGLQFLNYENLDKKDLTDFLSFLTTIEPSGRWMAVDICESILHRSPQKFEELKDIILTVIMKEGFLSTPSTNQMSFFQLSELIKRIHNSSGFDKYFVVFLSNEILSAVSEVYFNEYYYLAEFLEILLTYHWDISWSIIGNKLIESGYSGWFQLIELLKKYKKFEVEKIMDWTEQNSEFSPLFAVRFIDFEKQNGSKAWSPIMLELINKYGKNSRFLHELSAALNSSGVIMGSIIPFYKGRIELLMSLTEHPIEQVKSFALKEIENFESNIRRAQRHEENENFEY